MVKVQPIPQELWGAMGVIANHFDFAQALTGSANPSLKQAMSLLSEYHACFGADGSVSQRGEVPQCWNMNTIFTPHRELGTLEVCREQLLLPFDKEVENAS